MARCVCCGCITDDDCCLEGFYFNKTTAPCLGLNGPYETAAECSAAALACRVAPQPIPQCFCQSGDFECCEDGQCRESCEEEELPP